jgi:hypothetical protein
VSPVAGFPPRSGHPPDGVPGPPVIGPLPTVVMGRTAKCPGTSRSAPERTAAPRSPRAQPVDDGVDEGPDL